MKIPKRPQTIKEIDTRVEEIAELIREETKKINDIKGELEVKTNESERAIMGHEILIEEYKLILKHYREERVLLANPSSRDGRNNN